MRVLVTRPEPQASIWAADLQSNGLDALAVPLIEIAGPADPAPVMQAWHDMSNLRLLMFVSPAAVAWFFRLRPDETRWAPDTLAAAPGPGTAHKLLAAGEALGLEATRILTPDTMAEQFDSEALWPLLAPLDWQGQNVAVISGGDQSEVKGRQWLSAQWRARGASVASILSYQRGPGEWSPAQQATVKEAFEQPHAHTWLFSSSQAIDNLVAHHLPAYGIPAPDWSTVRAAVTHPKIAERCRQLGIQRILSSRPTLEAVVQALRSPQ